MKPILFNSENVRAILNGQKTATRRAIKIKGNTKILRERWHSEINGMYWFDVVQDDHVRVNQMFKPPYCRGEILYVRETWDSVPDCSGGADKYFYKSDGDLRPVAWRGNWKPSIHMPKDIARIFLKVTDLYAERLRDIDDEKAKAEGANFRNGKPVGFEEKMRRSAIDRFAEIWNGTIRQKDIDQLSWSANPWVWVIEFKRITREEAMSED